MRTTALLATRQRTAAHCVAASAARQFSLAISANDPDAPRLKANGDGVTGRYRDLRKAVFRSTSIFRFRRALASKRPGVDYAVAFTTTGASLQANAAGSTIDLSSMNSAYFSRRRSRLRSVGLVERGFQRRQSVRPRSTTFTAEQHRYGINQQLYDITCRVYRAGVRFKF